MDVAIVCCDDKCNIIMLLIKATIDYSLMIMLMLCHDASQLDVLLKQNGIGSLVIKVMTGHYSILYCLFLSSYIHLRLNHSCGWLCLGFFYVFGVTISGKLIRNELNGKGKVELEEFLKVCVTIEAFFHKIRKI